ncbi:MAG: serine protease [Variovorax paradoxus]|uniref:Serine protease n=1 Tax=Variovorax paradoxus TaxID=34073 RepID=A0A2W5RY18_VARPD|nr:MAG: serine protease [Variovorax paradoxus]
MMTNSTRAAALLAAALHVGHLAAQPAATHATLQPEALFARVSPNVWVLQTTDAQGQLLGTGTAIATGRGTAVTGCHLLAQAQSVSLRRENVSYGASLEWPDVERGLCQLRVANLPAEPLELRELGGLAVGSALYVIGAPQGREVTLGTNLLAGIRHTAEGAVESLQLAAPAETGLDGGGIFDAQGRLVGMLGASPAAAATPTLAMPAAWVAQLPERGRAAIASLAAAPAAAPTSQRPVVGGRVLRPTTIEYELQDRMTGARRKVAYRSDGPSGDLLSFNGGSWIEKPGGEVVSVTSSTGGEFDLVMPPGGWVPRNAAQQLSWYTKYTVNRSGTRIDMDLSAVVKGNARLTLGGREIDTIRVAYEGYTDRIGSTLSSGGSQIGRYSADVWYAPELGRPVRFEMKTRGGTGGGAFVISETLELVSIR